MYRQLRALPSLIPKVGAGGGDLKHGLLYAKLFYFFFFAAIGCLVPYLNVYFAEQGLSGSQIGWLGSVAPLIALGATPFWGAMADRWHAHRLVLAICSVGAGLISLAYLAVDTFWLLMIVTITLTFFRTPIGSLLDSSVLDLTRRVGAHYGRQRTWGSVGFVLATLILSNFITLNDLSVLFWVHGIFLALICGTLAFTLPIGTKSGSVSLMSGMKKLTKQPQYMSFLGAMALLGIGTSAYVNFTGLRMIELGGDKQWLAWVWVANGLTEAPMMFLGASWFARFRFDRLIQLSFGAYVVVWGVMAVANTPVQLVACAAANGICFGILWGAAVNYAGMAAPPGLSATAQALVGAAQSGIGWSIGAVMAGYLWDSSGGSSVFVMASCAAFLAGLLFWFGNRKGATLSPSSA